MINSGNSVIADVVCAAFRLNGRMTEHYNQTVAAHYAAYRPPLHQHILKRALNGADNFSAGLDVGCGTGRSSVALAEFCERVYAVDASQSMLDAATPHHAITYLQGAGENIPLPDRSIDVATFAGSLFYVDFDSTVREISRVCRHDALIIAYDFEVLIENALQDFGMATHLRDSTYDHGVNFCGVSAFKEIRVTHERMEFDVRATDLAHILLADSTRHDEFVLRYKTAAPLMELARELGKNTRINIVEAEIFYSVYQFAGDPS